MGLVQELLGRGSAVDSATKVTFMLVEFTYLEKRKRVKASFSSYTFQRFAGAQRFITSGTEITTSCIKRCRV